MSAAAAGLASLRRRAARHVLSGAASRGFASDAASLGRSSNQALGIAQYAKDFVGGKGNPSQAVRDRTALFFADSYLCGASAIALRTNAPTVLRKEALGYAAVPGAKATLIGGGESRVPAEKAVLANSSAVREWDSNGTNFGYCPERGHTAGELYVTAPRAQRRARSATLAPASFPPKESRGRAPAGALSARKAGVKIRVGERREARGPPSA